MTARTQQVSGIHLEAYVGERETGLVHRHQIGCPNVWGVFFLSLQSAVVHGYRLCTCAEPQARLDV